MPSNPLEVEAILELAQFAGPGAASRLAEGRSIFVETDDFQLVVGDRLLEALGSYASDALGPPTHPSGFPEDIEHRFPDTMSAIRNLPDGIHNHSRLEEPERDLSTARQLLMKATSIGVLIPRLQLAIRETQDYDERAGIVAVLDRALDAHRELSDWCARAGAYNTERAAEVVGEFDELIREIQAKAAEPFPDSGHSLHGDVELGEGKFVRVPKEEPGDSSPAALQRAYAALKALPQKEQRRRARKSLKEGWRSEVENKQTVKCRKCGHETVDPKKKPGQKYASGVCPKCKSK